MSLGAVFRAADVAAFVLVSVMVTPAHAEPDKCVPAELHDDVVSFRTEDNVELSGLELGSGPQGVVLASSLRATYCDWLPIAQTLADEG